MPEMKFTAVVCWELFNWPNLPAKGCYGFNDRATALAWIADRIREAFPGRKFMGCVYSLETWDNAEHLLDFVKKYVLVGNQFICVATIERVYMPEVVNNTVGDYLKQMEKR
jgi:hypothetical protein